MPRAAEGFKGHLDVEPECRDVVKRVSHGILSDNWNSTGAHKSTSAGRDGDNFDVDLSSIYTGTLEEAKKLFPSLIILSEPLETTTRRKTRRRQVGKQGQ